MGKFGVLPQSASQPAPSWREPNVGVACHIQVSSLIWSVREPNSAPCRTIAVSYLKNLCAIAAVSALVALFFGLNALLSSPSIMPLNLQNITASTAQSEISLTSL